MWEDCKKRRCRRRHNKQIIISTTTITIIIIIIIKIIILKDAGIIRNRKEKATQEKITIQLEEINQKVLANEGKSKRYQQRVKQYKQDISK